jgi:hypothetical protein
MEVGKLLRATHSGELKIAGIGNGIIPCAVLEDGTRVLTQQGVLMALGRSRTAKGGEGASGDGLPAFLRANNLKPFISKELEESTVPIIFKPLKGGSAFGYRASVLPMICEVFLQARDAGPGVLHKSQQHILTQADILIRGLAHVGILALVDEATGYQEVRDKKALQAILDRYLVKEYAAWAKRFPDEFYQELFRLRGWQWNGMSVKRPSVVGHDTNDLVYSRLAPGVLAALKVLNPKNAKGRRNQKNTQYLTPEFGINELEKHLHAVVALMKGSSTLDQLRRMMTRAFPKFTDQIPLLLDEE